MINLPVSGKFLGSVSVNFSISSFKVVNLGTVLLLFDLATYFQCDTLER